MNDKVVKVNFLLFLTHAAKHPTNPNLEVGILGLRDSEDILVRIIKIRWEKFR